MQGKKKPNWTWKNGLVPMGKEYIKAVYCHPAYLTYMQSTSGEGNGTPLQYSCLENPMEGGAWKAAVHGVAEGWTRNTL